MKQIIHPGSDCSNIWFLAVTNKPHRSVLHGRIQIYQIWYNTVCRGNENNMSSSWLQSKSTVEHCWNYANSINQSNNWLFMQWKKSMGIPFQNETPASCLWKTFFSPITHTFKDLQQNTRSNMWNVRYGKYNSFPYGIAYFLFSEMCWSLALVYSNEGTLPRCAAQWSQRCLMWEKVSSVQVVKGTMAEPTLAYSNNPI